MLFTAKGLVEAPEAVAEGAMRTVLAVAAMTASGLAASAAEVPAPSRIDAVTVYPAGAEVVRLVKVKLERGEHVVILNDVTAQAQPRSIRVEGKATGRLDVGSVDSRVVSVPSTDAQITASERRRLELEIEKLRDERAVAESTVSAAQAQKAFIANLAELPKQPPAAGAGAVQHDWERIFGVIGSRHVEAQKQELAALVAIRELDRKITDLERKLVSVAPKQENRTEIKVFVTAGAPLEADLVVRYQVAGASWTPLYDARLSPGSRTATPKLALTRRAAIQQRSGEAWSNVALTLSTARPSGGTAAPDLRPWTVDFIENMPRPVPMAMSPAPAVRSRSTVGGQDAAVAMAEAPEAAKAVAAGEVGATVDVSGFQATFGIKDRVSVEGTGETKRVLIDQTELEPTLTARAVPRLDPKAYLYARFALPKTSPYLAGTVSLFRDQTYVGTGRLPQLAAGEEHELGFGPDDNVRVRHAIAEEKRGESGIISSSRTDQRSHKLTIKNAHERPINFTLMDHVPVSSNQDIRVEITGRTPTRRDIDDKRGVLAWDDKLNPDEEKTVEFGYRLSWPAAKQITHQR